MLKLIIIFALIILTTPTRILAGELDSIRVQTDIPAPVSISSSPPKENRLLLLSLPAILAGRNGFQDDYPPAGNSDGTCSIPAEAGLEDTSNPDQVIGNGTPQSCTSEAVVAAVAKGGVITFDCGPDPVTIVMKQTARIFNNTGPKIVLDGGYKVTLRGVVLAGYST